jgi:hypothetical protein
MEDKNQFVEKTKQNQEVVDEHLLNPEIRAKLNEIRAKDIPFYEKAAEFEVYLKQFGCKDVIRIDCDVCADEYLSEGVTVADLIMKELGDRNFDDLSEEEKNR